MGVPAFYRWLVNKYPQVVVKAVEHKTDDHLHLHNANADDGFVFDNLYLDMNGIIHPCFHPADSDADADADAGHLMNSTPTTFDQVFENIYAYIDRLLRIARPRNLLYLAIDGVAPRAKMNQQRSRRFRAAKDNEIAEEEKKLREEFESKGKTLLPKLHAQLSDSNVITPGTEFMHDLSKALNLYVLRKLNNDPAWTHLQVIISDATVPGEGEHKIMSFIRTKRTLSGYDPNTRHCLYGLDADLIMLALATHELYFTILREDVLSERKEAPVSDSTHIQKAGERSLAGDKFVDKQYEFLHVWILREYLELDLQMDDQPENFVYDVERIIDDFIFICFFVGNDFLPLMPTLELHENAIDLLMYVYKKEFRSLGGYLVDMESVNDKHATYIKLKRVEKFILAVGTYEEKIFMKRADIRGRKLRRIMRELLLESEADKMDPHEGFEVVSGIEQNDHDWGTAQQNNASSDTLDDVKMLENTKELKEQLKKSLRQKSDIFRDGNLGRDKVKLGSEGWKQRYYKEKLLVENSKDVESIRKDIVQKYTEGLCWVLLYYFHGIPSWNWYYPYHYGPFASDLRGLAGVKVRFEKGSPFRPFDQLMAVLPPKSAHALPKVYQELMTDINSNIIEFYPNDFEVDVDGKRFLWQGICKLPFIQEEKLLSATRLLEHKVEESDAIRNVETTDKLFVRSDSRSSEREFEGYLQQHTEFFEDNIMSFCFELPVPCFHIPRLLEGTQPPLKTIFEKDIKETVLWHENYTRPPVSSRNPHNASTTNEFGKSRTYNNIHADNNIKTAGRGGGFSAGRGRGSTNYTSSFSHNCNVNQRHQQFTLPMCYRNSSRGMANFRSSSTSNRGVTVTTQNSFWPSRSNGVVPQHENASSRQWRPVSHTPSNNVPRQYTNAAPPINGRGRGRGRTGNNQSYYSVESPDYKDHNHNPCPW